MTDIVRKTVMFEGERLTPREVRIARQAYVDAAVRHAKNGTFSFADVVLQEAMEAYPMSARRVVPDPLDPGLRWTTQGYLGPQGEPASEIVMLMQGRAYPYPRGVPHGRILPYVTPERAQLWADLLERPEEPDE